MMARRPGQTDRALHGHLQGSGSYQVTLASAGGFATTFRQLRSTVRSQDTHGSGQLGWEPGRSWRKDASMVAKLACGPREENLEDIPGDTHPLPAPLPQLLQLLFFSPFHHDEVLGWCR
jgi:hypothetical protein